MRRHQWHLETRAVHLPGARELDTAIAPPIYQTATFALRNAEEAARLNVATHPTRFYSRWGNPTVKLLENAVGELEGSDAALATSSGMGAIAIAILTAVQNGGRIVAANALYSGTEELVSRILPAYGIRVDRASGEDAESFARALEQPAQVVYLETPANPTLALTDIRRVARRARAAGAEVIVDNTFATPYNQLPLQLGATVVVHSATKYLGGHSDVTGGVLVARPRFVERAWHYLKLLGPSLGPFDAWLILRGIRTFALRMARHNATALSLAEWLETQRMVQRVHYPGLPTHPQHELARRQMRGFGGMLSFELPTYRAARRFVERVRVARLATSLGGVETLAVHPASMIHGMLTEAERRRAGINERLVRVSVGLEHPEDLTADFQQALQGAAA